MLPMGSGFAAGRGKRETMATAFMMRLAVIHSLQVMVGQAGRVWLHDNLHLGMFRLSEI
jgi:hypothetical protein